MSTLIRNGIIVTADGEQKADPKRYSCAGRRS